MPICTFMPEWEAKIIGGRKKQTIRKNHKRWYKLAGWEDKYEEDLASVSSCMVGPTRRAKTNLHIWIGNPRYDKGSYKYSIEDYWELNLFSGRLLFDNNWLARKDGFKDWESLIKWFQTNHKMEDREIRNRRWLLIRWF